jgi:hypothetical protein
MMQVEIISNRLHEFASSALPMENACGQPGTRRRSLRIVMRVPLFVNAVDSLGLTDWEQVETLVISLHGGLMRTRQSFPVGALLELRMCLSDRTARARVVWTNSGASEKGYELGFETLEPGFWDVQFPPDRWQSDAGPQATGH